MQTNPAVAQNKKNKWSESPWNQSGKKGLYDTSWLDCHPTGVAVWAVCGVKMQQTYFTCTKFHQQEH